MMRFCPGLILLIVAGCNHMTECKQQELVGDFQAAPFAHTICISLQENGHYQELGFLVQVPVVLAKKTEVMGVDGISPIDSGTWSCAAGVLALHSDKPEHREREFIVEKKDDAIVISQRGDPQNRYYRPNQPPLRMPVSGTPAAGAAVAPPPGIAGR